MDKKSFNTLAPRHSCHYKDKSKHLTAQLIIEILSNFFSGPSGQTQSDQKIEKYSLFWKVAKTVAKPKMPKYLQQSSIWKSKTSTLNHFWNLKIPTTNLVMKKLD
jgi:hypothetical protein